MKIKQYLDEGISHWIKVFSYVHDVSFVIDILWIYCNIHLPSSIDILPLLEGIPGESSTQNETQILIGISVNCVILGTILKNEFFDF